MISAIFVVYKPRFAACSQQTQNNRRLWAGHQQGLDRTVLARIIGLALARITAIAESTGPSQSERMAAMQTD
jgi:hypothetical protein